MGKRSLLLQGLAVVWLLAHRSLCIFPDDEDVRARMEEKAMSSISLKDLEELVEKQHYPMRSKLLLFEPRYAGFRAYDGPQQFQGSEFSMRYDHPSDGFHANFFKFPSSEIDAEASDNVPFYHSSVGEHAAYSPRWSHVPETGYSNLDVSSSSSEESRFEARNVPVERRDETNEDGCKTVIKKIRDPKGQDGTKVKSIIIEKACEYPKGHGPDAHIPGAEGMIKKLPEEGPEDDLKHSRESFLSENKRVGDSALLTSDSDVQQTPRDPLAGDYIDKMFAKHFKNFPSFKLRVPSLEKHHDRFSETLIELEKKDKNPEPDSVQDKYAADESEEDEPAPFVPSRNLGYSSDVSPVLRNERVERLYDVEDSRKIKDNSHVRKTPGDRSHNYRISEEDGEHKIDSPSGKPTPKATKKSFAYYRRDNPKSDPNNQEYAEEYAHGNYRSFSTSYDSDRDGPK